MQEVAGSNVTPSETKSLQFEMPKKSAKTSMEHTSKRMKLGKSNNSKKSLSKYQELLKKREEDKNDPSNPLYSLKSNYYRNNYGALTGVSDELFKLRRFPLFKLLKEIRTELESH